MSKQSDERGAIDTTHHPGEVHFEPQLSAGQAASNLSRYCRRNSGFDLTQYAGLTSYNDEMKFSRC